MALKAGVPSLYPRTASCSNGVEWFRSRGRFSAYPAIGAQVFYGSGGGTHTGIVYAYDASSIYTYEGNTSLSNDANGNKVMKRVRSRRDSYVYGYGLPAFEEGVTTADPSLKGRAGFTYAATASGPAGNSGSTNPPASKRTVIVRAGQTITAIAAAAGISVAALLSLNPSVTNPDQIRPGDTITLPAVPDGGQEPQQPDPTPPPVSPPASNSGNGFPGADQFGPGANNSSVTRLGELLAQRGGSRFYQQGPGPRWGEADRQAVKAFQEAQGWTSSSADGIPGPTTWALLTNHQGRDIPASAATKPTSTPTFPGIDKFRPGANNVHVTTLGKQLVRKGYGRFYAVGPGPHWSESDRRAVQAFQRAHGWSGTGADGYPGPQTWSRLMR
ncbi:peptidoglycan-binding protein [Kitasatospora purpeofusca]|uniref:peptidoglycan-binding protein n=1 Tax=Kitasatospora purpeofusca TaxID=67352 RepID=UPI00224E9C5E|nr:peptidoglycan-binding protein [Kitasatospora purpeofusca]MCX4685481.1 peptidoglycan-binding protein [Kitasatospora purpeofusca]